MLQQVLAEFKDLRVFALEPDLPERRNHRSATRKFNRYITRLRGLAEEIVLTAPWLNEIHMYVDVEDDPSWHKWDVVSVPSQRNAAILEGPLKALRPESDASDSESE
ncbi:hypothetical protein B0H17DRAFT_1182780 [Mycena rosella]|uniref:Uncharacterized protein n=1 Tax=Mycena rosella TaxID=1033263 RepID=A0AAD7D2M1_MYCRO|nr:hypothetical protein B0H17DRAFT_1182780 [Mycena rosella]